MRRALVITLGTVAFTLAMTAAVIRGIGHIVEDFEAIDPFDVDHDPNWVEVEIQPDVWHSWVTDEGRDRMLRSAIQPDWPGY